MLCCFHGAEHFCKGKASGVTDALFFGASLAEMNLQGLSVLRVRKMDWSFVCIADAASHNRFAYSPWLAMGQKVCLVSVNIDCAPA